MHQMPATSMRSYDAVVDGDPLASRKVKPGSSVVGSETRFWCVNLHSLLRLFLLRGVSFKEGCCFGPEGRRAKSGAAVILG